MLLRCSAGDCQRRGICKCRKRAAHVLACGAHLDSAAHVMLCRRDRDRVAGDVQPKLLALLSNVGEVLQYQLPRLVTAGSISH